MKAVEVFAIYELLDKQAATDKPWLPPLKTPLLYDENGCYCFQKYLKLLVCFSPTKS